MIIFGTRGVTGTKEKGEFHCPQCGQGSPFRRKRARRFFTLYFIPLIPLDALGEYIECGSCKGTFSIEVLKHDPDASGREAQALFVVAMKQVMISMLLADGVIDDEEVEALQTVFEEMTSVDVTEKDLREEIAFVQSKASTPLGLVSELAGGLNDHGKEMVLKSAYRIAQADGSVSQEELELMAQIAKALELSSAHYRGVLAEVSGGS